VGGAYSAICAIVVSVRNRRLRALNDDLLAQAERERLAKQASEARLRLLQAQIEPHFLFNTLGAVQQLAERRAPDAAALTGHLIRFLRSSMSSFRNEASTLGNELALVESYLQVMASRLGPRLRHHIAVPAELLSYSVRPTLLITLVENAIKHGIEPAPGGGQINLTAQIEVIEEAASTSRRLVIEVADTGVGMADLPGHGDGLSNLRSQLALAHGEEGALELLENEPQGMVARLILPVLQPVPEAGISGPEAATTAIVRLRSAPLSPTEAASPEPDLTCIHPSELRP
jgi:sensor histidine kinase YesM